MKIDIDIGKLNQLDRIEFVSRYNSILIILLIFHILPALVFFIIGALSNIVIFLTSMVIIICFLFKGNNLIIKRIKKLEEDFFEIKLTNKKRKKCRQD